MSAAAAPFGQRDRRETVRWTASLLVVLALHGALIFVMIRHRVAVEPIGAPPAAVLIDLPPAPPAAPEPAAAAEPPPVVELRPPEPEPQPPSEPALPQAEPSPAAHPPVTLPPPSPKPKQKTRPATRPPPRPQPVPAIPPPAVPAPAAAAPAARSAPASSAPAAHATWQAQLLAWLERHKRYPRVAQEQHQQGTAQLRFTLDRQGRVLSFKLDRSSGFSLLDDEVLALIQRAQPVPAPPPEIAADRIEVVVPVSFSLRRSGR